MISTEVGYANGPDQAPDYAAVCRIRYNKLRKLKKV
ncbi:MAG: hypothetical protein J5927_05705 [Oscillospiraceae bacterium]|nr:hypothetical protein [Oscillospiraceae bacterium]